MVLWIFQSSLDRILFGMVGAEARTQQTMHPLSRDSSWARQVTKVRNKTRIILSPSFFFASSALAPAST
jgi:hypothetical protein